MTRKNEKINNEFFERSLNLNFLKLYIKKIIDTKKYDLKKILGSIFKKDNKRQR